MTKVVLASSSPRRRELLSKLTDFSVIIPDAEEITEGKPEDVAMKNAEAKGKSIVEDCDIVVACDTVVALDGRIYGKPLTEERAKIMLTELGGKTHEVISGVYLRFPDGEMTFCERSEVELKRLTEEEIDGYIKRCSPLDKAGSYGIQDGEAVKNYRGDYDNIVGLPLSRIKDVFVEKGYAKE